MWVDLGFWRNEEDGTFHIHGVTGPDEYTTVVNDNLFTNVMARFNLRRAAAGRPRAGGARRARVRRRSSPGSSCDEPEVADWERAADDMAIPYDEHLGVHPQDQHFLEREVWDLATRPLDKRPLLLNYHPLVIYRFQVLKQADVVLALFLQGDHFTAEQKRADFEYYDPITTGDSTLSAVVQSIIAAEVGYHDLALPLLPVGPVRRPRRPAPQHLRRRPRGVDRRRVERAGQRLRRLPRPRRRLLARPAAARGTGTSLTYRVTLLGTRVRVTVRPDRARARVEDGKQTR